MWKKKINIILILFCIIYAPLYSQNGATNSYSPYSVYGVGDLVKQGTAYNQSMGGVGIATRNKRFLSYINPASITARDTLSFLLDLGVLSTNKIYNQNKLTSANNTFDIYNIAFTVPIYKKSAFIVGLTPYSSLGYNFSKDIDNNDVIGNTGNINYSATGSGGVYSLFFGPAVTFWNKFSVGIEGVFYFGNIEKLSTMSFVNTGYRNFITGSKIHIKGFTGKLGLQYEQNLGKDDNLTIGITYMPSTKLVGNIENYKYSIARNNKGAIVKQDTLKSPNLVSGDIKRGDAPKIAGELGLGLAYSKGDKLNIEFNYLLSDWRKSNFSNIQGFANDSELNFTSTISHSFRAGVEFVPNRNDIRYYLKRCSYRAGAYYNNAYFKVGEKQINAYGITFGVTLPVFRYYNGISLGIDLGQRGSMANNLVKETYANFVIGINISDIWFVKPQYD